MNLKRLREGDLPYILLYIALAHIFFYRFLIPGEMVFGTDTMTQSFPVQVRSMLDIFKDHSIPEWNPYIYSGMPLQASFSFHILYPGSWIFFFMPTPFAMGYLYIMHFCLMGIFFFWFAKHLGLSRGAAFVGGLLFMFNAHLISLVYPGHGGKIQTMTYLPLALMYLDRALEGRTLYNMTVMGFMVGLMFYGGHIQILFYCGVILFLFLAARLAGGIKSKGAAWAARGAGGFALAFGLGTLLYAVLLFPAWEYKGYTHRAGGVTGASSYEFATSFSEPPEDLLYVPLQNPFGWGKDYGPTTPTTKDIFYKGRIGLRLSVDYFSVIGLLLAAVGVIFVRNRYTWFFFGMGLLTCFLALGMFNPFYYYVYKFIPGFSIFRVPYAMMILIPICGSVPAAFGIQYLIDAKDAERRKLSRFLIGGAALAIAVLGVATLWISSPGPTIDRLLSHAWVRQMLWGDFSDVEVRFRFFIRNLIIFVGFMVLALGLLYVYARGLLKPKYLVPAVAVLVLVELWPVGWEFIRTIPTAVVEDKYYPESPEIKAVEADKNGKFRVLSLVHNNELLYRGIEAVTGYHAVPLNYYEKAIDRLAFDGPLPDLLNARYLMLPRQPENDFANIPDPQAKARLLARYEPLPSGDTMYFYRNRTAMPRAWLVNTLFKSPDVEQELDFVTDPSFNPAAGAYLAEDPPAEAAGISPSSDLSKQRVEVVNYRPDITEFKVFAPADSMLVASEVWYPGWKAYIDGREAKVLRADYLLRAVVMPAGEHTLEMKFTPGIYRFGAAVSVITLLGMLAFVYFSNHKRSHPAA